MKNCFMDVDDNLLDYLEEENVSIEPKFFVPIIPIVLLNGGCGIATGYSSFVPNHRLSDIVSAIVQILHGDDPGELVPYYEKFEGSIVQSTDFRYISNGLYTHTKKGYEITELPLYTWTEPFLQKLQNMKEVSKVTSRCDDVTVNIQISTESSSIERSLSSTISTSNMYLLNENSELQKFSSALDILKYFVNVRLRYYAKRKIWILAKLEEDKKSLESFIRFITAIKSEGIKSYMEDPHAFFTLHELPVKLMQTSVSELTTANLKRKEEQLNSLTTKIQNQQLLTETEMYMADLKKLS